MTGQKMRLHFLLISARRKLEHFKHNLNNKLKMKKKKKKKKRRERERER